MRGSGDRDPGRALVRATALTAAFFLFIAAGAYADDPAGDAAALRDANASLAAERQSILLEVYALDSRLEKAEREVAALRGEAARMERRETTARARLRIVRATLHEAQSRLEERLRDLYIEGDPDPLAVLLGSQSLEDAIDALDGFDRLAGQDQRIFAEVKDARGAVEKALRALERRQGEVADLIASAEAARVGLASARADRSAYLDRLAREQDMNDAAIAELAARADDAGERTEELVSSPTGGSASGGSGSGGSGSAGSGGSSPPPPFATGPPGARQMTVVATGYALPGTTATGIPVGWGVVAVDPSVIPLGTRMTIPGYGEGVAADTGSAVKGAIIDLWFPTTQQALTWGRRTVTITLH